VQYNFTLANCLLELHGLEHIETESNNSNCREPVFALEIVSWGGRLGNNLMQLSLALSIAEQLHANLSVPTHTFLQNHSWSFRMERRSNNCHEHVIRRHFYYEQFDDCFHWLAEDAIRRRTLLKYVLPSLTVKPATVSNSTLVIHIRSGDIFEQHPHRCYTQPPLAFYKWIIQKHNFTDVLVCTEFGGKQNPVIRHLQNWPLQNLNITVQKRLLEDDISLMLGAENMVLSVSTLSSVLALMSPRLSRRFVPYCEVTDCYGQRLRHRGDLRQYIPHVTTNIPGYCYEFPHYIRIGDWNASETQINLLSSYPEEGVVESEIPCASYDVI
jgi:hypothetical protein